MKNLVLLTTYFPFGTKEPFLETEIFFLSKKFDIIYVIATKPDSLIRREVPNNLIVLTYPKQNIFLKSIIVLIKHGFSTVKYIFHDIHHVTQNQNSLLLARILKLAKHIIKAFLIMDFITKSIPLKIDQYLIYSYWFNSAALTAGLLKKKHSNFTAISRLHRWDLYSENNNYNYLPLQQTKAILLDKCFFISDQGKRYFENKYGILPSYFVSKLGVMKQTNVVLEPLDCRFHIVSCSYLHPGKRVNYIIEALALIDELDLHWTHIGGGDLFEELNAYADAKIGLKRNISFKFTNNYSKQEVLEFYKENYIHLFINTSISEGLPVAIMEAMSFAIPVIATDVGGTSEIVNETCGLLIDKNCSHDDIKRGIMNIYSNYATYPYRKNAFYNWLNNFNAEINYSRFSDQILS